MKNKVIVTGSSGLVGSAISRHFSNLGWDVHGIDNNMRGKLFGLGGDTLKIRKIVEESCPSYIHHDFDIRDYSKLKEIFKEVMPDAIIHTAGQPSHDYASQIPLEDFEINALSTVQLLEATRQFVRESPFIFFSSNKVYGDAPNKLELKEMEQRWEFADSHFKKGISENFQIDNTLHSLMGASKVAADIMTQEYGKYYDMNTVVLRGGCLTGSAHAGVELHGFLNYLVKCNLNSTEYKIFGYKGKQVRDNLHAEDIARLVEIIVNNPTRGEVYNLGGGYDNSCSILEAFQLTESFSDKPQKFQYIDKARAGDHICYYSDLSKLKIDYPSWRIQRSLKDIIQELVKESR